jgi:hypothetical protein
LKFLHQGDAVSIPGRPATIFVDLAYRRFHRGILTAGIVSHKTARPTGVDVKHWRCQPEALTIPYQALEEVEGCAQVD